MIAREGELIVVGDVVNYNSVVTLRQLGDQLIAEIPHPVVDFRQVKQCDSAGLALMVAWLRRAKQLKKTIRFQNVPPSLQEVGKVCGVNGILQLG